MNGIILYDFSGRLFFNFHGLRNGCEIHGVNGVSAEKTIKDSSLCVCVLERERERERTNSARTFLFSLIALTFRLDELRVDAGRAGEEASSLRLALAEGERAAAETRARLSNVSSTRAMNLASVTHRAFRLKLKSARNLLGKNVFVREENFNV